MTMRAAKGVEPALYNIPQVCELLSIGRSSAYELISSGRLQTVRIPGLTSMRVTAQSVRDLLASAPAANRAEDSYRGSGEIRRIKDGLPPSPRKKRRRSSMKTPRLSTFWRRK
jgi:excisionase family DNA binding protein